MLTALWIIAVVEIIRVLQNFIQLMIYAVQVKTDIDERKQVYEHFKDALREETAKLFAKKMMDQLDERYRTEESEESNEHGKEDQ